MEPMNRRGLAIGVVTAGLLSCSALATPPKTNLSLRATDAFLDAPTQPLRFQDEAGGGHDEGLALSGPYFLRSADPEEAGELELKFIYGFEDASGGGDEHELEFVLEWGMTEDVEFIMEIPYTIADGAIEGNGDIAEFGFHIRHWREDGMHPAVATRHFIRIPTGYHSDGVDYLGRALLTWTLIPDELRLHFNPFLKTIGGNDGPDTRNFQWGAAIGVDYRVSDDLVLIADYQNFSSEENGVSNQHALEIGADWTIGPSQKLGFQADFELDGDDHGSDFGFKIAYIVSIDAPRLDAE